MLGNAITGLTVGAAYALLAVAVVLVYTGTRVLAISLGEIGAFALYLGLYWHTHGIWLVGWHVSALGAALVAVVVGMLLGALVERLVMRPLVQRPPLDAVIANLGLALLLALLEVRFYDVRATAAPSPVGTGHIVVARAFISAPEIAALLLAVLVSVSMYAFLNRTSFGLQVRGATADPTVARLLGVKVNSVYRFTWLAGGGLAGAAAALLSPIVQTITPFGLTGFLLSALAGAVIGGLDSIQGAILGSMLVGVTETVVVSAAQTWVGGGYAQLLRTTAVLLLVLGTLAFRPRGLFGTARAV